MKIEQMFPISSPRLLAPNNLEDSNKPIYFVMFKKTVFSKSIYSIFQGNKNYRGIFQFWGLGVCTYFVRPVLVATIFIIPMVYDEETM